MKILKLVGIVVLILAALLLTIPAFLPSTVQVSESKLVHADPTLVFRQVNNLTNRIVWSPFEAEDPDIISHFEGSPIGAGSIHRWKSSKLGDGSLTIVESQPYSYVLSRIRFNGGDMICDEWFFEEQQDGVHVNWTITFEKLGYPLGRIAGLFIPGFVKGALQKGLINLKQIAEQKKPPYEVMELLIEPISAICVIDSVSNSKYDSVVWANHSLLSEYAQLTGLDIAGNPFAVFEDFRDDGLMNIRVCLPVWDSELRESGRILLYEYPGGNAIMATHYGHTDSLGRVHTELKLHAAEFQIPLEGIAFEVYHKGRFDSEFPDEWITEVFYPIVLQE
jgi:effector-binding domain-containing protein